VILEIDSNPVELIDFTELDSEQKAMVLEWRNSEFVSKYTHTKQITFDEHLSFIEDLKTLEDKKYFLVKNDSANLGVINLTHIDKKEKSSELGLYKNPFCTHKGVGSLLLKSIITYGYDILKLQKLKLEVYKDNIAAIKLYKRFGFQEVSNKNDKDLLYMEIDI
jgi:UDP-4-amino-4,6-dideoxy-N-acetyl-beta-L-altrosamine N-acetyltransferase